MELIPALIFLAVGAWLGLTIGFVGGVFVSAAPAPEAESEPVTGWGDS